MTQLHGVSYSFSLNPEVCFVNMHVQEHRLLL